MKTTANSFNSQMMVVIRQLAVTITVLVAGGMLSAAEPADLKTFTSEESYVVEGVRIQLQQKPGEATIKVGPALKDSSTLTAANGAKFDREHELSGGANLYKLQSAVSVTETSSKEAIDSLNQDTNVVYAYPVYVNAATGLRHFLNEEIVVGLKTPLDPNQTDLLTSFKLELVDTLSAGGNIYVFKLTEPKNFNPFKVCQALRQRTDVAWAEPNMVQEARQVVIPNDTSFGSQWHLRNAGQTFAFSDADVDADEAWDGSQGYGSPGIRVAILDDGVETSHADLNDNIVPGYDFYSSDSDPNPGGTFDNHGTAVAGVAAAEVNNSLGVAGASGKTRILPVRILNAINAEGQALLATAANVFKALAYAADNADVLNCSWSTSPNTTINAGFQYARDYGRGGKGCAILCASGNSAGGDGGNSYQDLQPWTLFPTFAAGNYFFGFAYVKNSSGSANDDCFWLADVRFPNGAPERFDSGALPASWVTFGNANWSGTIDPVHAHGTTRYAWRSGAVGDSQNSILVSPLATLDATHPTLWFRTWISSAPGDQAQLLVFNSQSQLVGQFVIGEGPVANRITAVTYPANLSTVLAVGASSDFDYRSHYSQYDSTLDFVAPSAGGYGAILTTDRTGSAGYDSTSDYVSGFGGTSSSAPLAAGIAALVLSKDGNLTRASLVSKLNENCDKINGASVPYTGTPPLTRNDYYGYGRLNAKSSANATTADTTAPSFTSAQTIHYRAVDATFNEPMGDGALTPGNYTITAGAGTLSSNPAKVLRIKPTVYRLIWNSGDIATSGTVTIQVSSSIKDVAGNAVTGTLSQSSTGTKRIVGVNCGNTAATGTDLTGLFYTPPYLPDYWPFQGNEFLTYYHQSGGISSYTQTSIDTSGVTDPAPQTVYYTHRRSSGPGVSMFYSIPNVPSGSKNVRLHFAEFYYNFAGDQVFDIYVQGTLRYTNYDILGATQGTKYKATTLTITSVTPDGNGVISIEFRPKSSPYWTASVDGIEVLKP